PDTSIQDKAATDPKQKFGTEGIAAMDRPSRITRFFMGIVSWAEGLNLKYAKLGNPPVYDNATFPWAAEIEKEWPAIRKELDTILLRQSELPSFQDISTDVKTISTDNRWKTFFLLGFGVKSEQNIKACPETWRIVNKIPGLKSEEHTSELQSRENLVCR